MSTINEKLDTADKALGVAEKGTDLIGKILDAFPSYRANKLFIEEIENNSSLSTIEKMTILYKNRDLKKEIKSQNTADILIEAQKILNGKDSKIIAGGSNIDGNWLLEFLDNCENTTAEDMKKVWAKILASECESPGSVSKRLLGILRIIDRSSALKFGCLCAHSTIIICQNESSGKPKIMLPKLKLLPYDNEVIDSFLADFEIKHDDMAELITLGLIECAEYGYAYDTNEVVVDYFGSRIEVRKSERESSSIGIGNYRFTKCGEELATILYSDMKDSKDMSYINFLVEFLDKIEHNGEVRLLNN